MDRGDDGEPQVVDEVRVRHAWTTLALISAKDVPAQRRLQRRARRLELADDPRVLPVRLLQRPGSTTFSTVSRQVPTSRVRASVAGSRVILGHTAAKPSTFPRPISIVYASPDVPLK